MASKYLKKISKAWNILFGSNGRFVRFSPPGHFYSPLPDISEARSALNAIARSMPVTLPGISLNAVGQLAFLKQLSQAIEQDEGKYSRYNPSNTYFSRNDALALRAILQVVRPRRIIEIGSGHSSALMLDTAESIGMEIEFIFIEPHPERLKRLLRENDENRMQLLVAKLQDISVDYFDRLEAGDVLFVDSSHVGKINSDVNYLLFHLLPRLKTGVIIHIHDIFWPFEYPINWLEQGRAWNETYLLRSFLQYNRHFELILFSDYLQKMHGDAVRKIAPRFMECPGASIWLRCVEGHAFQAVGNG